MQFYVIFVEFNCIKILLNFSWIYKRYYLRKYVALICV